MNRFIIILNLFLMSVGMQAQYTWERHIANATGGSQSNSTYSVTTSNHAYQAQLNQNTYYSGNAGFLYPELHTLPPRITSITDVPNDQGKQVQIVWSKSDYDDNYSPDKFYSVWRKDETDGGNFFMNPLEVIANTNKGENALYWLKDGSTWTYIDTIPALLYDEYSLIAPTLYDSVDGNMAWSTFKVIFHDMFEYYESEADSGYSVDNLAPEAPILYANLLDENVELSWDASTAEDFDYFAIYRSEEEGSFPPAPIGYTTAAQFTDYAVSGSTLYYAVTAFDFNGNESEFSNVETVVLLHDINLDITVFLEGPFSVYEMRTDLTGQPEPVEGFPLSQPYDEAPWNYTGTESTASIPENVVDWVLIELRDAPEADSATSDKTIDRQAAFLLNDGSVVGLDGISNPVFDNSINDSLFVVLYHRNHLSIMSSTPLTKSDGLYSYNFTDSGNSAYGGIQSQTLLGSGLWGMISGDFNSDGTINALDKSLWNSQAASHGYLNSDCNLDSETDNKDKNDYFVPNLSRQSQIPD